MHTVNVYRENLLIFGIKPEPDSVHTKRIMGENRVRINFVERQFIKFQIGDKINIFGEWFYLNVLPGVQVIKTPGEDYRYQMTFEGTNHILSKVQYLFLGDDNSLKEGEFSLTGTAQEFLELLVANTKRLLPYFDFTLQQAIDDGYRTLSFSSDDCLTALARIAEAFNTEYWVQGTEISLSNKSRDTGRVFRHGKQKGLYELTRQTVDQANVVTRLYAFGSDKNLPEGYRNYSKRLKMPQEFISAPSNVTWLLVDNGDGTQTYTFTFDPPALPAMTTVTIYSRPIGSPAGFSAPALGFNTSPRTYTRPLGDYEIIFVTRIGATVRSTTAPIPAIASTPQPALPFTGEVIYLEKNVDKYGLSEATEMFDEVYPHRTGTVSAVNAGNPFEFSDADMDFDLNDYLLPGMSAKVTFNSGQLSGYTFEISRYEAGPKRFTIVKNKEERAVEVPSVDLRPAIGDKYVLVDIYLPASYITAAETELQTKAQARLDKISEPQLSYQLLFDQVYLKERGYTLDIGDLVWIIDAPLEVERKIRVVTVQRNVVNEYDYRVDISDVVPPSKIQDLVSNQQSIRNTVSSINRALQNNSILNNRVLGSFYLYDLPEFADNAAALAGGLIIGQAYRTGAQIKVVHP